MKDLVIFNYGQKEIRTIEIDGEHFWIAKDVCGVLGIIDVSDAAARLDDDEKLIGVLPVSGQNRKMILINESGLYTLIIRSNKPEAKKFKRWITHEVLPSIRKTGHYQIEQVSRKQLAQMVLDQEKEIEQLEHKVVEDQPKVDFVNKFADSDGMTNLRDMGRALNKQSNKVIAQMREDRYLYKSRSNSNIAYSQYVASGLFKVQPYYNNGRIGSQTFVTASGLLFFAKKYKDRFDAR